MQMMLGEENGLFPLFSGGEARWDVGCSLASGTGKGKVHQVPRYFRRIIGM